MIDAGDPGAASGDVIDKGEPATVDKQLDESPDSKNVKVKQKRFKFLKDALDKVFNKVSAGKLSWYTKQFPTLQQQDPAILKLLRDQVTHQLETTIKMEIEMMLDEENIVEIMKNLDMTINNCKIPKVSASWRPTGNVDDDLRAHMMPVKMKLRDNLQNMLHQMEEENKQLQNVVSDKHKSLVKAQNNLKEYNSFFEKFALISKGINDSKDLEPNNPVSLPAA
ncbi:polyamine-modulated factor 1-like [Argonauta hians]